MNFILSVKVRFGNFENAQIKKNFGKNINISTEQCTTGSTHIKVQKTQKIRIIQYFVYNHMGVKYGSLNKRQIRL